MYIMSAWGNIQRKVPQGCFFESQYEGIHTCEKFLVILVYSKLSCGESRCWKNALITSGSRWLVFGRVSKWSSFYCGKSEPSFFLKWLSFFQPSKAHVEIDMLAHAKRIVINPELFLLFSHPSPIVPSHQQVWETVFTKRAADTVNGRNPAPPGINKHCK